MAVAEKLKALYAEHVDDLPMHAWAFEQDRWAELVHSLLDRSRGHGAEQTRHAVEVLQSLGLIDIPRIASASKEDRTLISSVLVNTGYTRTESELGTRTLISAAKALNEACGGKVQRILREHGERMRDELVSTLGAVPLDKGQLRSAITYWIQNTMSIPISLESDVVKKFCKANKITMTQLIASVDELDANVALVDDLLEIAEAKVAVTP
ncbi:MAG: hypothetical protein ABI432_16835 [Flavobacteriales bacterium]